MKTPLFAKTLVRADRVRSFHVAKTHPSGWEASERDNHRLVQEHRYNDWHRVEQTLASFVREVDDLRDQGWVEQ